MPFPTELSTARLRALFIDPAGGAPCHGRVTITATRYNGAGDVILAPTQVGFTLIDGALDVEVPVGDDADLASPMQLDVTVRITGVHEPQQWTVQVTAADVETVTEVGGPVRVVHLGKLVEVGGTPLRIRGFVRSVNGVLPDAAGNVIIPIGGGGGSDTPADRIVMPGLTDAVKTGNADATPVFQAAINDAAGAALYVPAGTYRFDGSVVASGTIGVDLLLSERANIWQYSNAPVLDLAAPALGTSRALAEDAAAGQTIVKASTTGITPGTWVYLQDNSIPCPGPKNAPNGELHQVQQVDTTGQLRTRTRIDNPFTVAGAAKIRPAPMITDARIVGGRWINLLGPTVTQPMIRLTRHTRFLVDVHMYDCGGPGITLSGCTDGTIRQHAYGFLNDDTNGNFGYGVEAFGATNNVRVWVSMSGGRHAFTTNGGATTNGVPRHIYVTGYATGMSETGFDTHEEGEFIHFEGVHVRGTNQDGAKHRAPHSTITDAIIENSGGTGVRFLASAVGGRLRGGQITRQGGIGVQVLATDVIVSDVIVDGPSLQGVVVGDGANRSILDALTILDASTAIEYQGTSTTHRIGRATRVVNATTAVKVAATVSDVATTGLATTGVTTMTSGPVTTT